jgi:hypothetical protein
MSLFINIDRFPSHPEGLTENNKIKEVKNIAKEYFGNVIFNYGDSCFPKAVKWLFTNADKEFIFNLEDDWEVLCDIPEYIGDFFNNSKIMQVGLRAWKRSDARFVLSPSFIRKSFCNQVASKMHGSRNPEEQIRGISPYKPEDAFLYWPFESNKVVLRDLGRPWIKTTGFGRGLDDFTQWRYISNFNARQREQNSQNQHLDIDLSQLNGEFGGPNVSNR